MNARILFAVVVSMFVCQQLYAQDEDEPVMPEATELEGTWEFVSWVVFGEQRETDGAQWRFEGNRKYYRKADDEYWNSGIPLSVNPSVMPAEIDLPVGHLGIYRIDGDLLTICLSMPIITLDGIEPVTRVTLEPGTRPDRFESTEDSSTVLIVLRRVEEDDE